MTTITLDDIIQIVRRQLGVRTVEKSDFLMEDLGAESSDIANIVASLESKSGIMVSESELVNIRTVADLARLFARN